MAIDAAIEEIQRVLSSAERSRVPVTWEEYAAGAERLAEDQRADVVLRMIELRAMQQLVDTPGYRERYERGLIGYTDHIEPLLRIIQEESGFDAAEAIIYNHWLQSVEADAAHQRQHNPNQRPRPLEWFDMANIAYGRLALTGAHSMTTPAKLAIWALYVAGDEQSVAFCTEQGLLTYLADAPELVRFLAEERALNGMIADDDALGHVSNVRPYMRRYIREYAAEREAADPTVS